MIYQDIISISTILSLIYQISYQAQIKLDTHHYFWGVRRVGEGVCSWAAGVCVGAVRVVLPSPFYPSPGLWSLKPSNVEPPTAPLQPTDRPTNLQTNYRQTMYEPTNQPINHLSTTYQPLYQQIGCLRMLRLGWVSCMYGSLFPVWNQSQPTKHYLLREKKCSNMPLLTYFFLGWVGLGLRSSWVS